MEEKTIQESVVFVSRTERFWDKLEDIVDKHFWLSISLSIAIPLTILCLIPILA